MNRLALDELLRRSSLIEDIGQGDVTSEAIFSTDHESKGYLVAKRGYGTGRSGSVRSGVFPIG
ncbi:MAG: hypothetical protein AB9917_00965 [Negativicutes bacterium]